MHERIAEIAWNRLRSSTDDEHAVAALEHVAAAGFDTVLVSDLDDHASVQRVGLDPASVMAAVTDPEVKATLKTTTEEAVARGVFGAPTFFVGDEMFFGQDRLEFVREAVLATR